MASPLPIDEEIKELLAGQKPSFRAIKAIVDAKRPRFVLKETVPRGTSLDEDMAKVLALLDDAEPCVLLVSPATGTDIVLVQWVPEAAAANSKDQLAKCEASLESSLPELKVRVFKASSKGAVTKEAITSGNAKFGPLKTEAYVIPSAGAKLELREITLPALERDEVQIEISHCGLCHTDLHMKGNDWGISDYPLVAGHEGYGKVALVGSAVTNLKVGDLVGVGWMRGSCGSCSRCAVGTENLCKTGYQGLFLGKSAQIWGKKSYNEGGCFSKVVRIHKDFAYVIPENIPAEIACPLMCAGGTVFEPLKTWVKPGDTVGIAGFGGLGTLGVQLAKRMGARVVVFSRGTAKKAAALTCGADHFVDMTSEEDMKKEASTIDTFIDTRPANDGVDHLLNLLQIDGALVRVGLPVAGQSTFGTDWIPMVFTAKKIAGSIVCGSKRMNEMVKLVSDNKDFFCGSGAADGWTASTVMPFSQINEGFDMLSSQSMSAYRIVLKW